MTHELQASGEAADGPEHDHSLPDALAVPVHADPADSDGPELFDDEPDLTEEEARAALADELEDAPPLPRWAGTERNEV